MLTEYLNSHLSVGVFAGVVSCDNEILMKQDLALLMLDLLRLP